MIATETLEQEAYDQHIYIDYVSFKSERIKGLYVDGSIAIKEGMTNAETADTLAEELEHHYTTVGSLGLEPTIGASVSLESSRDTADIARIVMSWRSAWKFPRNF